MLKKKTIKAIRDQVQGIAQAKQIQFPTLISMFSVSLKHLFQK